MNLFGFNIRISRNSAPAATAGQRSFSVSPEAWLRGEDLDNHGSTLSSAYEQVVWVYRAINVLAEQVANVPFVFSAGERGRENLITSGPLLDFYARPHPQINRFQYWELRVIWLMLRGECFRVPVYEDAGGALSLGDARARNPKSKIKRVLLLDPARFQHIVEDHQLIGWRYTGLGPKAPLASQVFLPEEVWFEKLPNPFDFWRGLSPLAVAGLATRTDFAAGEFMRGIIENNADTGVIVRTNEWLSDEQGQQILAALRDRKRRAGQADRPVLLLGSAEVIKPQLSSSDLQFLENRKFSRGEICAAFGVPEEIVTTTDSAKYDVMAGARLNFIENRVAPLCSRLEAEEEVTVKSIEPRASGWFDLDSLPIMQEARRNRLATARSGFEMGVPFNQLNRVLDLGFRPLPWGDRGYVASKLTEVGSEGSSPKSQVSSLRAEVSMTGCAVHGPEVAVQSPKSKVQRSEVKGHGLKFTGEDENQQQSTGDGQMSDGLIARTAELLSQLSTLNQPPSTTRSELSTLNQQPSTGSKQLMSRLRRFFFEQRGRALAKLTAAPNAEGAGNPAELGEVELLELADEDARLAALVQPLLEARPDEPAEERQRRLAALGEVNRSTLVALRQTMAAGRAAGEGYERLAARVKAVFNEAARGNAKG